MLADGSRVVSLPPCNAPWWSSDKIDVRLVIRDSQADVNVLYQFRWVYDFSSVGTWGTAKLKSGVDCDQAFSCTRSTWCLFSCVSALNMESQDGSFDRHWRQHPWLLSRLPQRNPQTFTVCAGISCKVVSRDLDIGPSDVAT